ncbi:MAG: hypothetical protein V7603_5531 [Micromonosporaceae bacterium]
MLRKRLGTAWRSTSRVALVVSVVPLALVATAATDSRSATAASATPVRTSSSSVRGSDGRSYTLTNHLVSFADRPNRHEWLLVWAGGDDSGASRPDFIAVIDASKDSATYGKVVNTATISPLVGNEPHHMQYMWHKGQDVYAGGILGDDTFVFNVAELPRLRITGVNLPMDTPCGSAPDAFWVLRDGTAYGTYMGGPNVSGPCTYTDGQVRVGNGLAGTPGEVVHLDSRGRTLAEAPAAIPVPEDATRCPAVPALPVASCANPHGIQVREDLNRMVTSDYVEIRDVLHPQSTDPFLTRETVRVWDISHRNAPRVVSVAHMPKGPRPPDPKGYGDEQRMVMETTVTNKPDHRGAFVSTMNGGVVYYTPDITSPDPQWREVFDDTAAYRAFEPNGPLGGAADGGSWLQTSPDDHYLFHAVMGSNQAVPRDEQSGMVYVLDIRHLVASGGHPRCSIQNMQEVEHGGSAPDCPKLVGVVPIRDTVSANVNIGPHWGALDNFVRDPSGMYRETSHVTRLAVSNYFVAVAGFDGDHRVCMINQAPNGSLSIDGTFRDEYLGSPCVQFNRAQWPHGAAGHARPHGVLFVVADRDVG